MKTMTPNEMALRIFLGEGTQAQKQAKLQKVQAQVVKPRVCPECGSADIEDNGESRLADLSFRCNACHHGWDAIPAWL